LAGFSFSFVSEFFNLRKSPVSNVQLVLRFYVWVLLFLAEGRWNETVNTVYTTIMKNQKNYQREHFFNKKNLKWSSKSTKIWTILSFMFWLSHHFFAFWFDFLLLLKIFNVLKNEMQVTVS
jgi:hypothetical protein